MIGTTDPVGSEESRINEAAKLLATQPRVAAQRALEMLRDRPDDSRALLLLGMARRSQGAIDESLAILQPLAARYPDWAPAHYEFGVTLGLAGRNRDAVAALHYAARLQPDIGAAWLLIADHMIALGDPVRADLAYANHLAVRTGNPKLLAPAGALCEGRYDEAERLLLAHLEQYPADAAAMRLHAEVAARLDRYDDAEAILARCLQVAPDSAIARYNYAVVLGKQNKTVAALAEITRLLATDPQNPSYRNLQANTLTAIREYDGALEAFSGVLAEYPSNAKIWLAYGHALKTVGRLDESIAAYRHSIELAPALGEAYWSLANLKTFRFAAADVAAMRAQLARADLATDDRLHFEFALGKALEDARDYAGSFSHYDTGNRLRRASLPPGSYIADETTAYVRRAKAVFTAEFLAQRSGWGCADRDPIFVVGLPRSGSTLLEQILSSHSLVEGTNELHEVGLIMRSLVDQPGRPGVALYPDILKQRNADDIRALGERYLRETRVQRKTGAPFFVDKMPNNWTHVGLIHLMLPNAKIIDARRHPLSCGWSNFKQLYARGQYFTYSLEDIGRCYRDYVDLMAHFDALLPGRVHRVIYEKMVEDTAAEVRRLLAYCGLPFEESCLRFYETERAVQTPSSEQVRQPIFRSGMEQWQHYEPWLGPLKQALGPVLDLYPAVPAT